MFGLAKEKSWSVRLSGGYLVNGVVKADLCKGCDASTTIVARNKGNPNLLLFGCSGSKCKHRLIRINFPSENYEFFTADKPIDFQLSQNISSDMKEDTVYTIRSSH
jgi:hypothetical protein